MLSDAAIAGHDRAFVAAIAWLNQTEARRMPGRASKYHRGTPLCDPTSAAALARHNNRLVGSAAADRTAPAADRSCPSIDAGEITDKGYLNQRGVLTRRSEDVEALFREPVDPRVILAGD